MTSSASSYLYGLRKRDQENQSETQDSQDSGFGKPTTPVNAEVRIADTVQNPSNNLLFESKDEDDQNLRLSESQVRYC